jgi:pyruvate dehydrogenase E2 component (dihydrolipoamide acetyltransferase)
MPYITMPKLSDTMTMGRVIMWNKKVGDKVKFGDVLGEIETDKANMEMESMEDGIIISLLAEDEKVVIGTPLGFIQTPGEEIPEEVLKSLKSE